VPIGKPRLSADHSVQHRRGPSLDRALKRICATRVPVHAVSGPNGCKHVARHNGLDGAKSVAHRAVPSQRKPATSRGGALNYSHQCRMVDSPPSSVSRAKLGPYNHGISRGSIGFKQFLWRAPHALHHWVENSRRVFESRVLREEIQPLDLVDPLDRM
jgi:hypothetical protein